MKWQCKVCVWFFILNNLGNALAMNMEAAANVAKTLGASGNEQAYSQLKQFNPESIFERYTQMPFESQYYGNEKQLSSQGAKAYQESEIVNTLKEIPTSSAMQRDEIIKLENSIEQINPNKILENSFCAKGECVSNIQDINTEFSQVSASLSAAFGAGQDIDGNIAHSIFKGRAQYCQYDTYRYNNCCKDSGWGNGILTHCSRREQALISALKANRAIYLGKYCSHKKSWMLGGGCDKYKRAYCVFDSELALLIQQQGRVKQLKKSFGSPKHPNCSGLSIDEFSSLNLEEIEYGRYLSELSNHLFRQNAQQIESLNNPLDLENEGFFSRRRPASWKRDPEIENKTRAEKYSLDPANKSRGDGWEAS